MHQYFVIGPFADGFFYAAYRYSYCPVAVPVVQFTSEKAALEYVDKKNENQGNRFRGMDD